MSEIPAEEVVTPAFDKEAVAQEIVDAVQPIINKAETERDVRDTIRAAMHELRKVEHAKMRAMMDETRANRGRSTRAPEPSN